MSDYYTVVLSYTSTVEVKVSKASIEHNQDIDSITDDILYEADGIAEERGLIGLNASIIDCWVEDAIEAI